MTAYRVLFGPEALRQLIDIDDYLANVGAPGSDFVASIVDYCDSLGTFPNRGRDRSDLLPGLRTTGYKHRVTIAYTIKADTVNIVGVFYGGQDYDSRLASSPEAT